VTTRAGQTPRDDGEGASGAGKDRVPRETAATPVHPGVIRAFRVISRGASLLVALTGLLGLLGWLLDVAVLRSVLPSLASMKVNTAVSFMLAGSSAWLLSAGDATPRRLRAGRALAAAALVIGLVTLFEYLFAWKPGIDDLLLHPASGAAIGLFPGRMAPATAANFVLIGLALLLIDARIARSEQRPAEWFALLLAAVSLVALLGYLYGARSLYTIGVFSSMALHTAFAFLACSVAILLARPERGLARMIASATPGGSVSRRMLPAAVLIPVVTGWLRLKGQHSGLYGTEFGLALFASSNVFCFSAFTAWTARVLVTSDAARRQSEEALREKEEHLEITLRSIGDGVISTDSDCRVIQVNSAAEKMTGWSSSEAQGMALGDIFRIVNEETRRPAQNPAARVLREGVVVGLANHTALISRDGFERSIADSGAPIRDARGVIRGVVMVFRDMTEERKAEAALRKSEILFSRLSSAGIIGIMVADLNGRVTDANEAVLRALDYSRQEILSGSVRWTDLTPPEWRAAEQAALLELKAKGISLPREKEYIRKDGSRAPVLVGAAMLDDINCIAFILDLTERKRAEEGRVHQAAEAMRQQAGRQQAEASLHETEEQLRQSQKMEAVGRLAGGIAHDFNNLLSVILSYGEMLAGELRPEDPIREQVDEIVKAGVRAASLTRQLLAFSRQQVLQPHVLDLNETIGGIRMMLGRLIGEDVELAIRPSADLGRVFVDPGQIEQIIMNLVVNARDAMPTGESLRSRRRTSTSKKGTPRSTSEPAPALTSC